MKWPAAGACLAVLLQTSSAMPLRAQAAGQGSIEGAVVCAGTGEPIPGSRVTLGISFATAVAIAGSPPPPPPPPPSSAVTDGQGKFVFKDLNPGPYRVSAAANGYAKQEYGQRTFGGQGAPITVSSGQTVQDIEISLTPAGNITGRIRDNSGQPAVGMQVQLLKPIYNANGQRTFQASGAARTDDRGEYRLFWVTPGRFYLLASNGQGVAGFGSIVGSPNEVAGDAISPTFYPSAGDISQAASIEVKPGADIGGVDIFVTRQSLYRIRGRVFDGRNGQTPTSVNITLITPSLTGSTTSTTSGQSYNAKDGSFEIRDVAPGPHIVRGQLTLASNVVTPGTAGLISSASAQAVSAQAALNVTSDLDGVALMLTSGVSLTGQLSMEGSASGSMDRFRVQLRPSVDGIISTGVTGPVPATQATAPNGAFRIDNVLPGEYRLAISPLPPDVYIKQARFNQADILNKPMQLVASDSGTLEIVLSPRSGQIDGTASDDRQRAVPGIQTVLIPDRQRDRIDLYKIATTDANGQFSIRGIAPGDYRIFAWEAIDTYAYFDPDLLKQQESKGKPVHIIESSRESIDVRMIAAEP